MHRVSANTYLVKENCKRIFDIDGSINYYYDGMAELRKDPVSGNWVVTGYPISEYADDGRCPFCPGNEMMTPHTIRECTFGDGNWQTRCFPAANSVFVVEELQDKRAEGIYDKMGNMGAHEIIVEHRDHNKRLGSFTETEYIRVINVCTERIADLKKDIRFKYILVFRNYGELAGSHNSHPHSHVLATPIMPKRIDLELVNSLKHYEIKERCLFCDIIRQEIRQNKRVVTMNAHFIAICPFASRFPFETWILPRFHDTCFENLHDENLKREYASIFLDVVRRIEANSPAYSLLIHTSPNTPAGYMADVDIPLREYFHWHVEILPKTAKVAKYRTEDEFYVIPGTPEQAASILRGDKP